jgi:hypothetical protein
MPSRRPKRTPLGIRGLPRVGSPASALTAPARPPARCLSTLRSPSQATHTRRLWRNRDERCRCPCRCLHSSESGHASIRPWSTPDRSLSSSRHRIPPRDFPEERRAHLRRALLRLEPEACCYSSPPTLSGLVLLNEGCGRNLYLAGHVPSALSRSLQHCSRRSPASLIFSPVVLARPSSLSPLRSRTACSAGSTVGYSPNTAVFLPMGLEETVLSRTA